MILLIGNCRAAIPAGTLRDSSKQKNLHIVALPVLYYSPETRLGFGAAAFSTFKLKKGDTTARSSNLLLGFVYTLNKQSITSLNYSLLTPHEKYFIQGWSLFQKYPEYYYGIGNDLPDSNADLVHHNLFSFEIKPLRKIVAHFFAGFHYGLFDFYSYWREPDGLLETEMPTGYNGGLSSGIGPAVIYDSRDNIVNASRGFYADVEDVFYAGFLGSDFRFTSTIIDLRKFFLVNKKRRHVLALNCFGQFDTGDPPYKMLGEIGGEYYLRGYYTGRYRDKDMIELQAEYRFPIWRFIGATVFAGAGDVAPTIGEFDLAGFKPCYGGGLRVMVNKKDLVNIRLDLGFGKNTSGFYLDFGEAF